MPGTTTLTIGSNYEPSSDPASVPFGGKLKIVPPSGGCLICLDKNLGNSNSYTLTAEVTVDLNGCARGDTWTYSIQATTGSCSDGRITAGLTHTIQIGSSAPA